MHQSQAIAAPHIGEVGKHAEQLAEIIERAARNVPFYASHLRGRAAAEFEDLPTCTKRDLRAWGPFPLQAEPMNAATRYAATSGTTGPRMFVGFSSADWERIGVQLQLRAAMVGLTTADVVCNTHGYGLWIGGPTLDLMAIRSGATLVPVGPGGTAQLLDWLAQMPITTISATPSFLRLLAERVISEDLDVASWSLRLGLIGGEPASPALRRFVVDVLGPSFRWQEIYGLTEVGGPVLGWSPPCDPFCGDMLLDTDEFIVELLHPDRDEPVAGGEIGEITITTPTRQLAPLIRYRTRDLTVARSSQLEGYPVVGALLGRVDDALKVRGALVYPGVIEQAILLHCEQSIEWRVVVTREPTAMDDLTIIVEESSRSAAELAQIVEEAIGVRCRVETVPASSLQRFEGKAQRVIDDRAH